MKNLLLSFLVILISTACAQRLQQRVKPGAAGLEKPLEATTLNTGPAADLATVRNIQKVDPKPEPIAVKPGIVTEPDAKKILEDEAKRAGEAPKEPPAPVTIKDPANKPPLVAVPGPSSELPSNCAVDFPPLSETEGARVLTRLAGTWTNDTIALALGPKNEQISFSRIIRNDAGVITSSEKKAQAVSYAVSSDVHGYRLLSIMSMDATGKLACSVVGLRLEMQPGSTKGLLHLIPPAKTSTSLESFVTNGKPMEHTLKPETI